MNMINTFSLVLAVITGISGVFWCIKRLYAMIDNCIWYKIQFFKKLRNIYQHTGTICSSIIVYCVYIFEFISSFFPILLLVFVIRSFVFEPFQIPSGSMMPTLLIGDFILVKKFVYGIKNPINQKTLINIGNPKRGDVIVFKYPKNPVIYYIKRVIGEPGDRVIYNIITKELTIYPDSMNNIKKTMLPIVYDNIIPSDFIQEFHTSKNGMVNTNFIRMQPDQKISSNGIRLIQTTESLNGSVHNILTMIPPGDPHFIQMYNQHTKYLVSEWYVPEGEFFVMGDNRDNSSDSRYWGCVPERNVVGKAIMIWMSFKKQEGEWPTGIQFNRIGNIIK